MRHQEDILSLYTAFKIYKSLNQFSPPWRPKSSASTLDILRSFWWSPFLLIKPILLLFCFYPAYMLHKLYQKLLLILSHKPLSNRDIVITMHLSRHNLLLELSWSSRPFLIPTKMPKPMKLNNDIFQLPPFRNQHITYHIIKIVLRNTWNSQL